MGPAGASKHRATAAASRNAPAVPASPADTEPLPFEREEDDDDDNDDDDDDDEVAGRTLRIAEPDMSTARSAQDELDAAATLAAVVSDPRRMQSDAERDDEGDDDDLDDVPEDDEEDEDEAGDGQNSELSSDLSDAESRRRGGRSGASRRDRAGRALQHEEEEDDDDEEEDEEHERGAEDPEEDEDSVSSEESDADGSELSDDNEEGEDEEEEDEEAAEEAASAEATALNALAGLAAAGSEAQKPRQLQPAQRSRKKSLISAMDSPMLQEEDDRGDEEDLASDDGQSQFADTQELTTGDMLSSAIAGVSSIRQRHPTGDPNSAGSMLKKSLLANATDDDELVGAGTALEGIDASMPASTSSSRAGSPSADPLGQSAGLGLATSLTAELAEAAAQAEEDQAGDGDAKAVGEDGHAEGDLEDDELALPTADADDDATTDEAALRRREAMDALAKIEIGFALLRDRLYLERIEETCKESAMILDGTHPELIYLNHLIEARKQKRLQLIDSTFDAQEEQMNRVAKADEQTIWSTWRSDMAELRKDMMDDLSRKRRKLDREKRALDVPRPPRRHQVFETELVRNPERIPAQGARGSRRAGGTKRSRSRQARAPLSDSESVKDYVAFPDLRGLEEEAWVDLERLGIRLPNGAPAARI